MNQTGSTDPQGARPEALTALGIIRLSACALIVLYHAQSMSRHIPLDGGHLLGVPQTGWFSAVDFFFVMSAFLAVALSGSLAGSPSGARLFAAKRLIRIVPLYWLFTAVFAALYLGADGGSKGEDFISAERFIKSLLFIPMEGDPIIPLGWTMNFEMFFYFLCAISLLVRVPKTDRSGIENLFGPAVLFAAILILVGAGLALDVKAQPLAFWTDPIMLDFAWGTTIAMLYRKGVRIPLLLSVAMFVPGLMLITASDVYFGPRDLMRPFTWGGGAAIIVAAIVLCRASLPAGWLTLATARLNQGVFSVYLSHVIALKILFILYGMVGLPDALGPLPFIVAAPIIAFAGGYIFFLLIERPLTRYLLRRLL